MSGYLRPHSIDEALSHLANSGATIAAGCTDLFPATERPVLIGPILDITGIPELRTIDIGEDDVRIGATTTWSDVIRADLPPAFDMLKEAAGEVGSIQIQNVATVVGNICNASPAADGVPCLLALDAVVEIAGFGGFRYLPLTSFIQGARKIDLRRGELVTGIIIPQSSAKGVSKFAKLGARRYLVISIAMVAVRLVVDGMAIRDIAISIGACSATATRVHRLEESLIGASIEMNWAELVSDVDVIPDISPIDDIRADAAYRSEAAVELIRRTLTDLAKGIS